MKPALLFVSAIVCVSCAYWNYHVFAARARSGSSNPVSMPLPMRAGTYRTPQFQVQNNDRYDIEVAFQKKIPFEQLCGLIGESIGGGGDEMRKARRNSPFQADWRLYRAGKSVASGLFSENVGGGFASDEIDVDLGDFNAIAGEKYTLEVDVKRNVPKLDITKPRLSVNMNMLTGEGIGISRLIFFLLLIGAVPISICLVILGILAPMYPASPTYSKPFLTGLAILGFSPGVLSLLIAHSMNDPKSNPAPAPASTEQILRDDNGAPPIESAIRYGDADHFAEVMRGPIDVNARVSQLYTPLHIAAAYDRVDMAKALIAKGASVDPLDPIQQTPLDYAARAGSIRVARLLIEHGATVNPDCYHKWAPLRCPTCCSQDLRWELNLGTPLFWAINCHHIEIAKLLIEHGADVNVAKDGGWPVDYFSEAGGADLERMENAGIHDANEWTALHVAAARGFADEVELLVNHGADVEAPDSNGDIPIDIARRCGHPDIARMLSRVPKKTSKTHTELER